MSNDSTTDIFEQLMECCQKLGYEIGIMEGESPVQQGMAIGTEEFVSCVLQGRPHERWYPPNKKPEFQN